MRTFKSSLKVLLMLAVFIAPAMMLTSCADTDDYHFVPPITQYEKIAGKWVLNTVTQVDETNSTTMNLTNQFNFDSFSITLNTDENDAPTTFAVQGSAPALLPTSGTWALANEFVNSDGSSAVILLNDKTELTVTAVPGASKTLEFKLTRKSNGIAFVSYVYNLVPAEVIEY